ncbi:hypothetical protein [Streptomyces guryensis]|uniref:Uncharacterized protein n=1 Tax=Streptomyces guryensis TaxID=2886947 RepID=A0A9Q3VZS9_9ACTN|nr:hypothetical protein [Streptomyces guryensis]MCD9880712.1 hypothetical protein [Streptomyces guryensis]
MSFGPPPSMYTRLAPPAQPPRPERRPKWPPALLALVLVAAAGTGGRLLWGAGHGTKTPTGAATGQGLLDIRETVEKKPANTTGKMAFRFSVCDLCPGEHYEMPGMWATDKFLAKGINKTVVTRTA